MIQAMFSEKDQFHEMSHWACDIGHFCLNPILPDMAKLRYGVAQS